MIELNTKQDVGDLVRGATFLGTGGGGSPATGKTLLVETLKEKSIVIQELDSISNEAWFICPFGMGSIAPKTKKVKEKRKKLGLTDMVYDRPLVKTLTEFEKYKGIEIEGVVSLELGGYNTPAPIDAAVRLGKKVVDGDYAGRAIPEIEMITPVMNGKALTPLTCVDPYGNISIIKKGCNPAMVERIGKFLSDASFGGNSDAGILMKGKEVKDVAIGGTISESIKIGRKIRKARETGKNPVQAITDEEKYWLLFKGTVVEKEGEDKEGYYWGIHKLEGKEEFEGRKFKFWFKNENHISWLDGEPYVTSPDLINVVKLENGEPITNPTIEEGDKLAIVGVKAREPFRTEKGLKVLGPKHFGYDIDYSAIEEIVE